MIGGDAAVGGSFHSVRFWCSQAGEAEAVFVVVVEAFRLCPTPHVHTRTMTLKNAALLALIGTILMTALLVWTFVLTFLNVLRDLVPAVTLLQSFIYAFGCFSVAVFFYVFHRAQ